MNVFECAILLCSLYLIFTNAATVTIFISVLTIYYILSRKIGDSKQSGRRTIQIATWTAPSEGNIYLKEVVDLTNTNKFLKENEDKKLTLNHVALKALANAVNSQPDCLRGRIVFGRFKQLDHVDISCLVDIDNGTDLASIIVEKSELKTITQIKDFVHNKVKEIKVHKGDQQHKEVSAPSKKLHSSVLQLIMNFCSFLSNKCQLNIPLLKIKKNQFGICTLTNLKGMKVHDAVPSFPPVCDHPLLLTVCDPFDGPRVVNGEIKVVNQFNANFVIDHRYCDGGKAKPVIAAFRDVFENPWKYK